jgi:hypothetical protein
MTRLSRFKGSSFAAKCPSTCEHVQRANDSFLDHHQRAGEAPVVIDNRFVRLKADAKVITGSEKTWDSAWKRGQLPKHPPGRHGP